MLSSLSHQRALLRLAKPLSKTFIAQKSYLSPSRENKLVKFFGSKELGADGRFVGSDNVYTAKEFENSKYAQHMKRLDKERLRLVDEKLQLLAESAGVEVDELKKQLETKVEAKLDVLRSQKQTVDASIADFEAQLALPSQKPEDLVEDIVRNLADFERDVSESPVFRFLNDVDPAFAQLVEDALAKEDPTKEDVVALYDHFNKGGPISELTKAETARLVDLLFDGTGEGGDAENTTTAFVASLLKKLKGVKLENSELFKLVESKDKPLSELLSKYLSVDAHNLAELKAAYAQLEKAVDESAVLVDQEVEKVLNADEPITIEQLFAPLKSYKDYIPTELFKKIRILDAKFASEVEKSGDPSAYLEEGSPIWKAMNEVKSSEYQILKEAIEEETHRVADTLTVDRIVQRIEEKGFESAEFKAVQEVDAAFAEGLKSNEVRPSAAIEEALGSPTSEAYHILSRAFQKKDELLVAQDKDVEILRLEDQTKLPAEVAEVNATYDMAIEVINELKAEIEQNRFESIDSSVSDRVSKMLGFQPSEEQTTRASLLRSTPLPQQSDEVLELCVNLVMSDGRKNTARKYLNKALYLIYLKLRTDPVVILKQSLDKAAPLVITKTVKTGFAKNYTIPVPLTSRQRNRMAFLWIIEASKNRASSDFGVRLAEEILNVYSGDSKILEKRVLSHKLAIANRSYLRM